MILKKGLMGVCQTILQPSLACRVRERSSTVDDESRPEGKPHTTVNHALITGS
ncbi:hypothetical protein LR48_Vigan03g175300 [Vigna angularis]|uniref:Uncharacterized protein n=1 Tax=Phaseolus angularis TaxID=3914 RepID=A0A0L9U6H4_PHAAN|nr:hypothetical protein LR48_Vigan03g175300 [Vigna angularis]